MMTYLSTSEVAARLGITTRTASMYAKEGRFPGAFRVGIQWRVPEAGLRTYVERQTPSPRGALTPRDARSIAARKGAATRARKSA